MIAATVACSRGRSSISVGRMQFCVAPLACHWCSAYWLINAPVMFQFCGPCGFIHDVENLSQA